MNNVTEQHSEPKIMKILILSDSHGNYPLAIKALDKAGQVDHVIHLGDGADDVQIIENVYERKVISVAGNCDFNASIPREIRTTIDHTDLFITHGHNYNVKMGIDQLYRKAAAEQASIVLYGHTHIAAIETISDILFINPGCLSKNCTFTSYAILSIVNSEATAEIVEI